MMMSTPHTDKNGEIVIPVSGLNERADIEGEEAVTDKTASPDGNSNMYLDQLQRLQAEFSNYKKRIDNERKSIFSLAKSEVVLKLLPILDDFERMVDHQSDDWRLNLDGMNLIYQNFKKVLTDEGLEEIPSLGEKFDPGIHEAVCVEETEADKDGMVVEEWQKGYRFGDRILRPSRVKVGRYLAR